ncbi:carboxypeptidase B [Halyomorpha halys]|uniref:carboxypeptidase B n=1 Tax=Halyomorpha halys TaxID=286706 RepID=UPI0006D4DE32
MIPKSKLSPVKQYLRTNQLPFQVMIDDVQQVIEQEKELSYKNDYLFDDDGKLSMDKYHRLSVIHDYLSSLVERYPEVVSDGIIGFSWEGKPLKYIKISSGKDDSKAVFIDAGIHAREWISPAAVLYVTGELTERRKKLPKELLDLDFYILPVLNPDGYEYTHTTKRLWRKNRSHRGPGCQGIDLNRNFDIYWAGKGTSRHQCSEVYVGPAPFSEPESLAIADFLLTVRNLKAYISVHSYSQLLLLPYAYDSVKPSDYAELKETGDRAAEAMAISGGEYYQVGTSPDILYPASGSSADWAKAVAGVKFSYTFELRDTGKHGFLLPASQIVPTGKELFEAIKVIAAAAAKS